MCLAIAAVVLKSVLFYTCLKRERYFPINHSQWINYVSLIEQNKCLAFEVIWINVKTEFCIKKRMRVG